MSNQPGLNDAESELYEHLLYKRNCSPSELQTYQVLRLKINHALQERTLPPKPELSGYARIAAESLARMSTWRPSDAEPPAGSGESYSRHHYRSHIRGG